MIHTNYNTYVDIYILYIYIMNLVGTLVRLSGYLFFQNYTSKKVPHFSKWGLILPGVHTTKNSKKIKNGTFFTKMVPFLPKWYLKKGTFFGVSCPKKVTFFKMRLIIPTTHKKKTIFERYPFLLKKGRFRKKGPFF